MRPPRKKQGSDLKTEIEYKEVPIRYGLLYYGTNEPSFDEERQLFPHRREYSLGGCVITPYSPKTTKVHVCSECKQAYARWKAAAGKTK